MPIGWRVYYGRTVGDRPAVGPTNKEAEKIEWEGRVFWRFGSDQGTPWEAPRTGVLFIAQLDPARDWEWLSTNSAFYYEEAVRGWGVAKEATMHQHMMRAHHPLILYGQMVTKDDFSSMIRFVMHDSPNQQKARWLRDVDAI